MKKQTATLILATFCVAQYGLAALYVGTLASPLGAVFYFCGSFAFTFILVSQGK